MQLIRCSRNGYMFGEFPMICTVEKFSHESRVKRMPGSVCHQTSEYRLTDQGKIAQQVKDLVPHKLVRKSQRGIIQHTCLGKHDRVFQGAAIVLTETGMLNDTSLR